MVFFVILLVIFKKEFELVWEGIDNIDLFKEFFVLKIKRCIDYCIVDYELFLLFFENYKCKIFYENKRERK